MDRLILATVSPLVICALLPLTFGIHFTYLKRRGEDFSPIVSRYVSMFLLITYAVLPSVCTTIFGAFSSCLNIDPEGLSGTYSLYLPKDLSISCNSSRYYYGVSWAAVMMVIYPLGIPCLYLYLLFLARAEIILGKEKQITASSSKTLKNTSSTASGKDVLNNSNHGRSSLRNSDHRRMSGQLALPVVAEQPIVAVKTPPTPTDAPVVKKPKDTRSKAEKLLGKVTATANSKAEKLLGTVILVANNHAAKILSEEGMLKYVVNELEFLHRDYVSSYWYWEIVLTYDKLLLTAVISIIYPGTNEQILIGWIMAFVMMRVQTMASPYLDHYDDSLKKIADYQVLLFLFIAIIKQGNVVTGIIWGNFLEIIMIVLIFWSPLAAFWYAFVAPSETVANLRTDQREQKAKAFLERQAQALKDAMSAGNLGIRGVVHTSRKLNASISQRAGVIRRSNENSRRSSESQLSQRDAKIFSRVYTDRKSDGEVDNKFFDTGDQSGGGGGGGGGGDGGEGGAGGASTAQKASKSDIKDDCEVYSIAHADEGGSESSINQLPLSPQLSPMMSRQPSNSNKVMWQQPNSSRKSFSMQVTGRSSFPSNRSTQKVLADDGLGIDNDYDNSGDNDDDLDDNPLPSATITSLSPLPHNNSDNPIPSQTASPSPRPHDRPHL